VSLLFGGGGCVDGERDGESGIGTGRLGTVGNVVWFLLGGFWLALAHGLLGIGLLLTVIGIPFGLQHLKRASLAIAPIGKSIVTTEVASVARRIDAEDRVRRPQERN
jgi:uncharacterized membrane protein YccF (DUF307 family)